LSPFAETWTVARTELTRTLRSPRAVVLLLVYATFTALTALVVGALTRGLDAQLDPAVAVEARSGLLGMLVGGDSEALRSLAELPLIVPLVFRVSLFFLPLYVTLIGFDQLSAEVGSKSVRYLVFRARRASILFGKFLAQAVVLLGLLLVVQLGVFIAGGVGRPIADPRAYGLDLVRFWGAGAALALAYLALSTLASALTTTPAGSLFCNIGLLLGFWALDVVGSRAAFLRRLGGTASWTESLRWLSPSAYASGLLGPASATLGSITAYAVFGGLFLVLAWATFRVRDL
jgi:ABC-2 type transport system permease protein